MVRKVNEWLTSDLIVSKNQLQFKFEFPPIRNFVSIMDRYLDKSIVNIRFDIIKNSLTV